ncbi:DoxX family protein [Streptosporangium sp. KLBMP 9127]|nr:DoxX family protein [Streptosporangium sp. KLBMP 9127]
MRRTLRDLATLAARIGVGGIFFANGWHKLEAGLTATGGQFAALDAPAPGVWAAVTMLTELIGGALLVAGLVVPFCGLLLFAEALAVFFVASGDPGQPLTGGDVNLIVALGAASILLGVTGAGRLSVDHMVVIKRREAEAADDFAADSEAEDVLASLREPMTERHTGERHTGERHTGERPVTERPTTERAVPEKPVAERAAPGRDAETPRPRQESGDDEGDADEAPKRRRRTSPAKSETRPTVDETIETGDMLVAGRRRPKTDKAT